MRGLAALSGAIWIAAVVIVVVVSSASTAIVLLLGVLGLLLIATLAISLSSVRQGAGMERNLGRRMNKLAKQGKQQAQSAATSAPVPANDPKIDSLVRREVDRSFKQLEALQNLYSIIDIRHALPASRGWPASPDLLLMLVDLIDRHRPKVVVECGSGLSTLCFALAMRRFGIDGRVIALEHLETYAEETRELLRRHGVDDIAEVRYAPLEPVRIGEVAVDWYAGEAWQDITDVELFFVDGPPSALSPHSRYPSVPFFLDRLPSGAHIVLDDYRRAKEQDVVKRWQAENPDRLTVETVPLEKGAALIRVS
ncbi:O-methyltransferase [Nocardioides insulae]|uniref:O-methyltransferase n=1 Tax=Nocardioides insulae TaxID=394734 RepID=UPI000684CE0C|nr:class I SAM-dependent methyltransferase [Nocardioides insulae]